MARCQAFYKMVFGWEFATPPNTPEGTYAMFSKPGTKLAGGIHPVKEADLIQPKVNSEGQGQATNKIILRVEEVDAALKNIEAAGGKTISYVLCAESVGGFTHTSYPSGKMNIGPEMGYVGMFRDTEGNINGVWSMK
jgi:predicted enzyme related to lactoylglutathione lyase